MTETKDYDVFYRQNKGALKKLIRYKLGQSPSEDLINDTLQNVMLQFMRLDVLNRYDSDKASYDTYICTCLYNYMYHSGVKHRKYYAVMDPCDHTVTLESTAAPDGEWYDGASLAEYLTSLPMRTHQRRWVDLVLLGYTFSDAAELTGFSPQAVHDFISKTLPRKASYRILKQYHAL
jgi:DNA-directed RNA polymerase specialized sigma24 family protein